MDENNYFKLFDQYIGKSKLVPELYKQVKKDFPKLDDAVKFSYSNSFSDDIYDNYGESDYQDNEFKNLILCRGDFKWKPRI